jgi:CheY-like chemotaxis protein
VETVPELDLTHVRALVVDDNATNRLILQEALRSWGAQVTEAEDGMRAVARFEAAAMAGQPFDLVLIDCRMPLMDGFQVAEALRHLFPVSEAAVMMLTSDNRSGDVSRARDLGFGSYLVKPLKRSDLLRAIRITLGRPRKADEKKEVAPAATAGERPLQILLADDSEDNRLLIRNYLKNTPHRLDMVENGKLAVEQFVEGRYDLVLMDMQMPVMDGCTATRAIREWEQQQQRPATPIVALTANAMKEDVERTQAAGCTAHVTKPVKKATLLQAIVEFGNGVG